MRIVLPTLYGNLGGSTRVLLAAAEALRAEHEVRVRAPLAEADDPMPDGLDAAPLAGTARKLSALPRLARLVARERAYLARVRPDLIYVHDEPALYVHGLAARTLRSRPKVLWHVHMGPGAGATRRLREALADARIVISRHAAGPSRLPTHHVRNPLLATPPNALPYAGPPTITVVGTLTPRKNQLLAIEALACLRRSEPEARLVLLGEAIDRDYAATLGRRAAGLGLAKAVAFAGARPPAALWREVRGAVLFPALYENQPLALVEALAAGHPVVATDIPAHREIVEDVGADPATLVAPEAEAMAAAASRATRPSAAVMARTRDLFLRETFDARIRTIVGRT